MPREHPRPGQDHAARLKASQEAQQSLQDARHSRPKSQGDPPPFVERHLVEIPHGASMLLKFDAALGKWVGVMTLPGQAETYESQAKSPKDVTSSLMGRYAREARKAR